MSWMVLTILNKVNQLQVGYQSLVSSSKPIDSSSVAAVEVIMAPQLFPITTEEGLKSVEKRLLTESVIVKKLVVVN